MTLSDEAFAELRMEWKQALPGLIAGEPDRTDLMLPLSRLTDPRRYVTINEIIRLVAKETKVAEKDIRAHRKNYDINNARHLVHYIASEMFRKHTLCGLAKKLKRDRTTVLNSLQRAADLLADDGEYLAVYHRVRAQLGFKVEGL